MPEPLFLFATQRSGTNYLRSLLRNTGLIHDFGEVFNTTELQNDRWSHQYFLYRLERLKTNPELSIPYGANIRKLFFGYLEYLEQRAGAAPFFLIDIKYSSLHHFDTIWQDLFQPNFIFQLIQQKGYKALHLVRSNHFEVFVSHQFAERTGRYHLVGDGGPRLRKIRIDPQFMLEELERLASECALVRSHLWPIRQRIEIEYSDLCTTPNNMPQHIGQQLSDFLGCDLKFKTEMEYQKIIKDPFEVIRNRRKVARHLADSPFRKFLPPRN